MSQWADGIGLKAVGLSEHHSAQYDIKNENHVIVTIRQRHTLCHYEKRELEMIETTCHVLEPRVIDQSLVNPKVKAKALKLPPRKCSDEIACQWE